MSVRKEAPVSKLASRPPIPRRGCGERPATALSKPGIAPARRWVLPAIGRPISGRGLAVFTRQLATLVKAGMPILRSLEVLARQEKRRAFRTVLEMIADTIRSGGSFSDGLSSHAAIFDRLYVNMARAGEAGGVLDTVLDRLAGFLEKSARIRGRLLAAMVYPIIISLVAALIMGGLMVWVVPVFQATFLTTLKGRPLPWLTQAVVGMADGIRHHVPVILSGFAAVAVLAWLFRRSSPGARVIDRLLLRIPVLGDLFLKAAVARFTRTFGTLLGSGVPILQALIISRDTSGNGHVARAIEAVHDRVREGANVADPIGGTGVFPDMVASMVEVGEETGALPDMLTRIADIYDEEVDNAVAALTSILEPLMIVFMALGVGLIVIAMFLPMVELIRGLGG
ncbi:MAG: type II secretion system F family protein [Opitutus sp.]